MMKSNALFVVLFFSNNCLSVAIDTPDPPEANVSDASFPSSEASQDVDAIEWYGYTYWTGCTNNEDKSVSCGEIGVQLRYLSKCLNASNPEQQLQNCSNQPFDVQRCTKCCPGYCEETSLGDWQNCGYYEGVKEDCGHGYEFKEEQCLSGKTDTAISHVQWLCTSLSGYKVKECDVVCKDVCNNRSMTKEIQEALIQTVSDGSVPKLFEYKFPEAVFVQNLTFPNHFQNALLKTVQMTDMTTGLLSEQQYTWMKSFVYERPIPTKSIRLYVTDYFDIKPTVGYCEMPTFGEWLEWPPCIAEKCGMNITLHRKRLCKYEQKKVAPENFCIGSPILYNMCFNSSCYVLSDWFNTSSCRAECGFGKIKQERNCTAFANGSSYENKTQCNETIYQQEIDCHIGIPCYHYSEWNDWSISNQTISTNANETAMWVRERQCYADDVLTNSSMCKEHDKELVKTTYNDSDCSVTCGNGTKERKWTCFPVSPQNDTSLCAKETSFTRTDILNCSTVPCPEFEVRNATNWTECSATCGPGVQYFTTNCHHIENNSIVPWELCEDADQKEFVKDCMVMNCSVVFEVRTEEWSECSATCAGGNKTLQRYCFNKLTNQTAEWHDCTNYTMNSTDLMDQIIIEACNENYTCNTYVIDVETIGICNVTCGNGFQPMRRNCKDHDTLEEVDWLYCESQLPVYYSVNCTSDTYCGKVNGSWSEWGIWGKCSVSCDNGTRIRNKECVNKTHFYLEAVCKGISIEQSKCVEEPCVTNQTWGYGSWSIWGECSERCGPGYQHRSRECEGVDPNNPVCENVEVDREERPCNERNCAINGGWSEWGFWSICSKPCGLGRWKSRKRTCTNPVPKSDGLSCTGYDVDTENCSLVICKVDGTWTEWGKWRKCNRTCGGGWRNSTRKCYFPPMKRQGAYCEGESVRSEKCNPQPCQNAVVNLSVRFKDEKCVPAYNDPNDDFARNFIAERIKKNIKKLFPDKDLIKDVVVHGCGSSP